MNHHPRYAGACGVGDTGILFLPTADVSTAETCDTCDADAPTAKNLGLATDENMSLEAVSSQGVLVRTRKRRFATFSSSVGI